MKIILIAISICIIVFISVTDNPIVVPALKLSEVISPQLTELSLNEESVTDPELLDEILLQNITITPNSKGATLSIGENTGYFHEGDNVFSPDLVLFKVSPNSISLRQNALSKTLYIDQVKHLRTIERPIIESSIVSTNTSRNSAIKDFFN